MLRATRADCRVGISTLKRLLRLCCNGAVNAKSLVRLCPHASQKFSPSCCTCHARQNISPSLLPRRCANYGINSFHLSYLAITSDHNTFNTSFACIDRAIRTNGCRLANLPYTRTRRGSTRALVIQVRSRIANLALRLLCNIFTRRSIVAHTTQLAGRKRGPLQLSGTTSTYLSLPFNE